ncbi:YbaB/EbfC family nucleoid-associated protein [Nocardia mangyaensis]|uniref:YbaB/EbfC family nucleoid-associated protein n=1 Tax=Nocardia mangyaensis TaxID=2213200 RepID=UPI0026755532|nr:YbaB/EbfC family nucleoid-associated protein [Nocardia mangyaensis]MDO3651222.1 YbaB/EbfC family nucleoid-associated protein [Nocardia mangyaensis]
MTDDLPEITRAGNARLRAEIDRMLDAYERDSSALLTAQAGAAEPRTVWSDDNLVRVTAHGAGVIDVHLEPTAFRHSTPEKLGASITATVQAAQQAVTQSQEQALASLTGLATELPDLPELIPGAPSTADLMAQFRTPVNPPPPAPVEDDDEYFRNKGYLR